MSSLRNTMRNLLVEQLLKELLLERDAILMVLPRLYFFIPPNIERMFNRLILPNINLNTNI